MPSRERSQKGDPHHRSANMMLDFFPSFKEIIQKCTLVSKQHSLLVSIVQLASEAIELKEGGNCR